MGNKLWILASILIIAGCMGCGSWSEKKKEEFCRECEETKVIDRLGFSLTGFSFMEKDSVLIKQIRNKDVVDSFFVSIRMDSFDSLRSRYFAEIDKPVRLEDEYHIIVPEQQTFILSGMKMRMVPQFTMFSEGYGCSLGEFRVNGELTEGNHPDFIKEGYQFPWEK